MSSSEIEIKIGEPVLTRYERARIVGARALQISHGAPLLIDIENDDFRPHDVANKELRARVLPIGLSRRLPNGVPQVIPVHLLKDREFITQIDVEDVDLTGSSSKKITQETSSQKPKKAEKKSDNSDLSLTEVPGIGSSKADDLRDAGYTTVSQLANATIKELTDISGIGKTTAEKYIQAAKDLL